MTRVRSAVLALSILSFGVGCFSSGSQPDAGADAEAGDAGDGGGCVFCVDSGPFIDPFGDASLALRTRALFAMTCLGGPESGCHSDHAANMTLNLSPDGGDVINVVSTEAPPMVRVAPWECDASYMFWKVSADPRIDGSVMPPNQPFDPRIPALIGAWIDAGAP